jgi:hypothetical protein
VAGHNPGRRSETDRLALSEFGVLRVSTGPGLGLLGPLRLWDASAEPRYSSKHSPQTHTERSFLSSITLFLTGVRNRANGKKPGYSLSLSICGPEIARRPKQAFRTAKAVSGWRFPLSALSFQPIPNSPSRTL